MKEIKTNNGKRGGLLSGKPHYDKDGNSLGGIKAVVTDAGGKPVELEGGEVIINKAASKKYWKELSKINQSAGNGVAIGPPLGSDEDPEEFKDGGRVIEFNPNHIPNKWVVKYAENIKEKHPEIWKLGGNIFGNEAYINLKRVIDRGHWLDSEEWMYIKWRSYVARHKQDFRIEGVVAMLKWCDKVDKGWAYMKDLIEDEIVKIKSKETPVKSKMATGGNINRHNGLIEEMNSLIKQLDKTLDSDLKHETIKKRIDKISKQIEKSKPEKIKTNKMAKGGEIEDNHLTAKAIEFIIGYPIEKDSLVFEPTKVHFKYKGKNVSSSLSRKLINDTISTNIKSLQGRYAKGGEIKQPSIEEITAILLNHLKSYSKEVYGEDIDDDSFMVKTSKVNGYYQAEEVTATTESGIEIHIAVNELYMEKGGELIKGIKAEKEHQATIDKIYSHEVKKSKAAELIAKDHLEEDEMYYSKLEKMEGKKFAGGGNTETPDFKVGDVVLLQTARKGLINAQIRKITEKWIYFDDLTNNVLNTWNETPKFNTNFRGFVDSTTIIQATPQTVVKETPKKPKEQVVSAFTKKVEPGSLLKRIEKLEATFIPSTDPSTWNSEYNLGDVVKIRVDLQDKYPFKKLDGTPVKYEDEENTGAIIKVQVYESAKRKENPSGKIYTVAFNGDWEGKDLELAYIVDKKQTQQQTAQQQKQEAGVIKKQVKTVQPEPIKRKFDADKDYLGLFVKYLETDNVKTTKVTDKMKRIAILDDFITSTQDIAGFDKDKLKKVHSYIKGE